MKRQRGVALAELVVTIAVIAVAGVTLVSTIAYLSGAGTEHLVQSQAQAIADAYLNEITGKCFADCEPGPEGNNRARFDDVTDYQGLDRNVATDEMGNVLGNYRVRVRLTRGTLGALPANQVWRIDVTVDYGQGNQVIATGYKTNHT